MSVLAFASAGVCRLGLWCRCSAIDLIRGVGAGSILVIGAVGVAGVAGVAGKGGEEGRRLSLGKEGIGLGSLLDCRRSQEEVRGRMGEWRTQC